MPTQIKPLEEYIGTAIMKRRKSLGKTATFLAKETGITAGFLHDIEIGRSAPSVQTLVALAKALNLPISEILPETGEATRPSPSDDIQVLIRLRHERPEIIKMLTIDELTDEQIVASFNCPPRLPSQSTAKR